MNRELIIELVESGNNEGLCTACGEIADCVEPDARNYTCDACGENKVFGADELLITLI
tara:strand:- start:210 stop:383 length:174 start_codon:yes stop_codon:yes gene_type:complete